MDQVTQVHSMTPRDILGAFERLESKIDKLQKESKKPRKYSIKELAKYCGVSQNTVRNWISEGKVEAKRLGRRIFISEEEFEKALSETKSMKYKRG